MTARAIFLLVAVVLGTRPLTAQVTPGLAPPGASLRPAALAAPALDLRFVVGEAGRKDPARPVDSPAWKDVVTRPRWRYPAIGAAIGITAGVVQAKGMQDPIGFPIDPIYIFPTAYGALGAFIGLLVDSADRERAARR